VRQLFPGNDKAAEQARGRRIVLTARFEDPLRRVIKGNRANQLVLRRPALSTLSIQEAFMAYFKVCIGCGFVLGSPWIFYQIWLFVAAGLYPNEKRLVHVYLPVSIGLFLAGVLVCQFLVIPKAIEALLWFNEWLGLEPDMRFNEWLGFAIMMPLVFGISFQLPLVMMFIERIGIFTVDQFKSQWRIAFFVIHVFAAIITPSVDIISMELLALPMFGLYWLGIILCRWNHTPGVDVDVPESEDMVEV
jgi:sec-independent protein translocase protein TatC